MKQGPIVTDRNWRRKPRPQEVRRASIKQVRILRGQIEMLRGCLAWANRRIDELENLQTNQKSCIMEVPR